MQTIEIVSFGHGHAEPPQADAVIDARRLFRNPHHDPGMRELTGMDAAVREHVLATDGIPQTITGAADLVVALLESHRPGVTLAVGCGGGRHRAPVLAEEIAAVLRGRGLEPVVVHRDVDKPVLKADPGPSPVEVTRP